MKLTAPTFSTHNDIVHYGVSDVDISLFNLSARDMLGVITEEYEPYFELVYDAVNNTVTLSCYLTNSDITKKYDATIDNQNEIIELAKRELLATVSAVAG